MGRLPRMHVAVAQALVMASLPAQDDVTRTGKTFTVVLHPGKVGESLAARLADEALAAAERVRAALEKLQLRPAKLPVIHVHADERPFRALALEATKLPYNVEGFVQTAGACAHVLMWPHFEGIELDFVGISPPTADEIMRHAVQLAAVERQPWLTADPWRARVLAHGVVDEIVNPGGAMGVDPSFDTRRARQARAVQDGRTYPLRSWLDATDAPSTRDDFEYFEEANGLIAATLAASGSLKKLVLAPPELDKGLTAGRVATFESMLGKDWAKNEARFTKVLAAAKPRWHVDTPMAALRDGRLLLVGGEVAASLACAELPPAGPYAIRATCELVPGWSESMRVQLDWNEEAETLIGCFVEEDVVWISRWEERTKKWHELKQGKAPILAMKPFQLSIEVDAKIAVVVDGQRVLEVDHGNRGMHGHWFVAKNRGPVWLQNLRCESLAPARKK